MPKKSDKPAIPVTTSNVGKSKRSGQLYYNLAYKYPLYPNAGQEREFKRIIGSNRWLRNHFIQYSDMEYFHNKKAGFIGYNNGFQNELTPLRNDNVKWLEDTPRSSQMAIVNQLIQSFTDFFNQTKNKPKRKSKKKEKQAFKLENGNFNSKDGTQKPNGKTKLAGDGTIRITRQDGKNRQINLPSIGWVRLRVTRELPVNTQITNVGISCKNGQWYVAVMFRTTELLVFKNRNIIGIDRNITNSIVLSDGTVFYKPKILQELERAIAKKQKDWDRKKRMNKKKWKAEKGHSVRKKGAKCEPSNKMDETMDEIRDLYEREADIRRNWLHHVTSYIAENYGWAVIENLNTAGMSKSNKGTKKKPGKNRSANKAKNKAIRSQGWGLFAQMLQYKMRVIEVPAPYTSMQCCKCPSCYGTNRNGQSFNCVNPVCSNQSNADWNAAINIVERGVELLRQNGGAVTAEMEQDIKQWKGKLGRDLTEIKF